MIGLLSNAAIHQMKNGGSKCTCRSLRYGDEWDDDHLVAEANQDFKKYFQNPFHYSHPLFNQCADLQVGVEWSYGAGENFTGDISICR